MADDEVQLRVLVHGAGHREAHHVQRHFVMPTPGDGGEPEADVAGQSLVVGVSYLGGRHAGMDVDRYVELLRPRQERREFRIVEKGAADRAADQGTPAAVYGDGALELVRGSVRDARRQM